LQGGKGKCPGEEGFEGVNGYCAGNEAAERRWDGAASRRAAFISLWNVKMSLDSANTKRARSIGSLR
jgi:hypothetical protein